MSAIYFAIPTNAGLAKIANALALGIPLKITAMAVGDGGGQAVTPDPAMTTLPGEKRRAPLNTLFQDPLNPAQLVAEQIIPENVGGWWIRCVSLYDETGTMIAIANSPDTYKPQLSEGSGRTQTIRMVLIVSDTSAVELKIDPSVVLATRKYVDEGIATEIKNLNHKASVKVATTSACQLSGLQVIDGISLTSGDRVLVHLQGLAKENGIYVVADEQWKRAADADSNSSVNSGLLVSVEQGSLHRGSLWQLVTPSQIILGSSGLIFERISGKTGVAAGSYNRVTVGERGEILSGSDTVDFSKDQVFPAHVFRKNQLINGNFDVWQRGSVFTTPNKGAYTADRWRVDYDGTPGTFTVSRQPWSPGGNPRLESAYYLRWAQTGPGTGGTARTLSQRIESVRTMAGLDVTVSFIAWADAPRTLAVKLSQCFGAAGASTAASTDAQSIAITTIPTAYAIKFAVPAINGKTITGVNDYLELQFMLPVNVAYSINIATVQLEAGDIETPFEHRPISYELLLCQRYFEVLYDPDRYYSSVGNHSKGMISGGAMEATNSFTMVARIDYKTTKRAIPALGNITLNAGVTTGQHKMISEYGLLCVSGGNGTTALITASDLTKPAWVDAEL